VILESVKKLEPVPNMRYKPTVPTRAAKMKKF